ncbi:unnamed protein product [Polarella glacialis]|uniref:Uncharacterized protein n=2 Tax=Polarella glacialis TaxID=89957 RepID=A0A813EA44_POLGL|nr:unnamed protein product [Polarella glacialis]CAE8719563.1 unnamed protein product [Polarella glacialis]|mmetsp:Transcript_49493/g.80255  ORF Transcript_49493/g.80255 Transcript_49493/m.80255 type:complete len:279 (+) Transcript_49493:172-1008(+)
MTRDARSLSSLVSLGALAVAAGVAVFVVAQRLSRATGGAWQGSADVDREQLLAILRELSRRFFLVCNDVAAIAKSVRTKIEANRVDITEDKLREQLARQCKVFEKLQQIQTEVAGQFGLTASALEELQQRASEDPEIESFSAGFRTMLEDALSGLSPILPNVTIPEELTEEKALKIQAEVHVAEAEKVLETIGSKECSLKELGEILAAAHKFSWEHVLEAHASLLAGAGPEVYHSAVAAYSRNPDFAKDKKKLEEKHQKKMIKLFQPDGNGRVSAPRK